jgi:hypothetical protein
MNQTVISKKLAFLHTSGRLWITPFFEKAKPDQVADWTFCHNEIAMPENWQEMGEISSIEPACHQCGALPDYNFAGYASMNLLHNNLDPLIILCDDCARPYQDYHQAEADRKRPARQLSLF